MEIWNKRTLSDLKQLSASEEEFRQLLSEFFSDAFSLVKQIQTPSADGVGQQIVSAHTLKGLAYSFGAIFLAEIAKTVEQELKTQGHISPLAKEQLSRALEETKCNIEQVLEK